jgi:hypothetical protein
MITLKILCDCGTKFAFEVDETTPLAGGVIHCPTCGTDAAPKANTQLPAANPADPLVPTPPAATRLSVRKPAAESPIEPVPDEAAAPAPPAARGPFVPKRKLSKAEQQIRRNHELARRRQPYVLVAIILVIGMAGFWGWYRFVGSQPKVVMDVQYERPERPLAPRLLPDEELLLVRNREVALVNLRSGAKLWEQSFGSITNFDDSMPIFSEVSSRVERATPEIRLSSNSFWIAWPDRILHLNQADGSILLSLEPPADDPAILIGERLLVLEKTPRPTNRLAFEVFPLAGGEKRLLELTRPTPDASLALIPDGDSVVALQTRLLERRIVTNKLSTGPQVMTASGIEKSVDQNFDKVLNENLTSGGSLRAATELVSQLNRRDAADAPDEILEDHSRYEVELKRVQGGGSTWRGEITGRPVYFPLPTVDVVAGVNGFKVIDKGGKLKWEASLSYPLSEEAIESAQVHVPTFWRTRNRGTFDDQTGLQYLFPFVERGNRLYAYDAGVLAAFDLASGEVQWRVTSVGIRKLVFDHQGALYAATTLDDPQTLRKPNLNRRDDPTHAILKIEPVTGKVLWQAPHLGTDLFVSGKFLYSQWVGENLLDKAAALSANSDVRASCAIKRIDPRTGEALWRREYKGDPDTVNIRGTQLLIQFPRRIEVLKFFSL